MVFVGEFAPHPALRGHRPPLGKAWDLPFPRKFSGVVDKLAGGGGERRARQARQPDAALGGGFQLLGNLPHVGRISMKPYVLGDQVSGVGESYLAFPSHCRVSPYSIAVDGAGAGNTTHQAEAYNHYGTGIAVRRP